MTKPPLRVAGPGFFPDMAEADYHADPAPSPSLSSGIASKIITGPAKAAWFDHPRLNPDFEAEDNKQFDLGAVAHKLLLQRGTEIHVIDAGDYKKQATRDERDEAIKAGKQPCLIGVHTKAEVMVRAVRDQLADDPENHDAFTNGQAEVVAVWKEPPLGDEHFYCRSMMDWLMNDRRRIYDFKTYAGEQGADPEAFIKDLIRKGRDIQDPHYSRGLAALEGCDVEEVSFRFVVVDPKPPHLVSVVELTPDAREWSLMRHDWALRRWGRCLRENRWPGFARGTYQVGAPAWAQMQWLDRQRQFEAEEGIGE